MRVVYASVDFQTLAIADLVHKLRKEGASIKVKTFAFRRKRRVPRPPSTLAAAGSTIRDGHESRGFSPPRVVRERLQQGGTKMQRRLFTCSRPKIDALERR